MSMNVTIGAWHVTPDQNKLSLDAKDYFVEPLAMAVLVYFAQNPNKVISLDELVESVWKGRVVGDHAIYRIINQIRKILSADENASYITTIRKKGYQLNQSVTWIEPNQTKETAPAKTTTSPPETETLVQQPASSNKLWMLVSLIPLIAFILWFGSKKWVETSSYNAMKPFNVVKPFSVLIGEEKDPSYSPDGKYISYSHHSKSGQNFKIFVQATSGESPVQVTFDAGEDFSPSWSPDSTALVFLRHLNGVCQIMRVQIEPLAQPEKILDCNESGIPNEVIWGPKDNIYYTDSVSAVDPYKIYKYSLKTSKKEQLTNPASGKSKGDIHMALSNNGEQLAFARDLNWGSTQIKLLNLKSSKLTDLFKLAGWRKSLAWSFDDKHLYFVDENDNINAYSIKYDFRKKVLDNTHTLHSISGHKSEDKLAIMTGETGIDIWGSRLQGPRTETVYIESSEIDLFPEFANTSQDIAFMSLRSGQPQIWIKSPEGREYQLSHFNDDRMVQRIRWSPSDQYILGSSSNEIYVIDVPTQKYQLVWQSQASFRIEAANWSVDGRSIYFSSDMDGDWQIYRKEFGTDSEPVRVTDRGGYSPVLLDSGEMLYYKYHQNGIWKMQLDTKSETKLVEDTNVFANDALYARNNGFFYLSIQDDLNYLSFYDLGTGKSSTIQSIDNPLLDLSISSDASLILSPKVYKEETEIRVLEKQY
ncbi:winged helix-turn-helix domain-containing protein [Arenicella xantha]|uniref:DNA-binding winged helix-turn-helix (WHTH) protein n=1 Tax=Arenicella xantha TaxID=644221 RepID=A0A395JKD8_9GAMM|nr:winged helix-turn-helix domain-containing protein [Arenicella xantha]RBP51212.1 DNA-binding winged helix-turn-helix (wHTH) protein [Arenicella xantha]